MKPNQNEKPDVDAAGTKGEKVREAIGAMLSNDERGSVKDAPPDGSPSELAAQERLAEIERHVGELVKDPELEQEGAAREAKK